MNKAKNELKLIPLSEIEHSPEIQPRERVNKETVFEYSIAMKNGAEFPPILVIEGNEGYLLVDGAHRIEAAKDSGRSEIEAIVLFITKEEAFRRAVQENLKNGLRFNNADKRRFVTIRLEQGDTLELILSKKLSRHDLAKECGVSHTFVNNLVKELSDPDSIPEIAMLSEQPTSEQPEHLACPMEIEKKKSTPSQVTPIMESDSLGFHPKTAQIVTDGLRDLYERLCELSTYSDYIMAIAETGGVSGVTINNSLQTVEDLLERVFQAETWTEETIAAKSKLLATRRTRGNQ